MNQQTDILDHWSELRTRFPADLDLEGTARAHGAFTRARGVKDAETLLRLALAYGACGMSLRETCAWAEGSGIASLADPSLLERLVKAGPWLGAVAAALVARRAGILGGRWAGYRLRALDGTVICEPGADRASWRLHVGYDLGSGQVDHIELTDGRGAESLRRLTYGPGEIVLADRYYARPRDLRPVLDAGADLIVRTGWNSLRFLHPDGTPFDLFAALEAQTEVEGEVVVRVHEGDTKAPPAKPLLLRLIIRRKDPQAAQAAQEKLRKDARKRGRKVDPRSLKAANYILLLTSLPPDAFPASDVLTLYRFRWQIEIAFKRMKSLGHLDALPAKSPQLARAWIYARLIAILIAEQSAGQVPDSPPWAPPQRSPVTMAPREDDPRHHPPSHPRTSTLAHHPKHLHQNPQAPLRAK